MADQLDVVERVLQILAEGRRSSTYKLAVLVGLLDLCQERTSELGWPPTSVTTRELAEKVIELYWPQVGQHNGRPLAQNRGQEGAILATVRVLHDTAQALPGPGASLHGVRSLRRAEYEAAVDEVEWKLIEMPLPKLQRVGGDRIAWLYRIEWDDDHLPTRGEVRRYQQGLATSFDNCIRLLPDVALAFVRLHGLLRPFVEQQWVRQVAAMNALEEDSLHGFLFGRDRQDLGAVRPVLLDLQRGGCFYCGGGVREVEAEVDHFLPWSRHPDDGLDNLVIAHRRCNRDKSDFLAAAEHVGRWRERSRGEVLDQVADSLGWDRRREQTLGAARALYLRLPPETRLWRGVGSFEEVDLRRVSGVLG
ncbi:MAG: HNH endonuclease domain-containing protein [Pseudomonadota bacterium]